MERKKFKIFGSSGGYLSRILLITAVLILIVIIIVIIVKVLPAKAPSFNSSFGSFNLGQKKNSSSSANTPPPPTEPIYETKIGDIKFTLISFKDLGGTLKSKSGYQGDLTTTEKFIWVEIGAENEGKLNTDQTVWGLGNVIDSEGRVFTNINNKAYYYMPQQNQCGAILQPAFAPIHCVSIYEVAKVSKDLSVEVIGTDQWTKKQKSLLDLKQIH